MNKKPITIHVTLEDKQLASIPLLYDITQENPNIHLFNCKVNLEEDKIPEWLSLREFTIRQVKSDRVTVTEFGAIPVKTVNDAFLVGAAHEQIRANEKMTF